MGRSRRPRVPHTGMWRPRMRPGRPGQPGRVWLQACRCPASAKRHSGPSPGAGPTHSPAAVRAAAQGPSPHAGQRSRVCAASLTYCSACRPSAGPRCMGCNIRRATRASDPARLAGRARPRLAGVCPSPSPRTRPATAPRGSEGKGATKAGTRSSTVLGGALMRALGAPLSPNSCAQHGTAGVEPQHRHDCARERHHGS